jgi:hypothetical protein
LAILDDQLSVWRSAGFDGDVLEMWAIGYPGQEEAIPGVLEDLPEGYAEALFVDTSEVDTWGLWEAHVNDLFVVDQEGMIVYQSNLATNPLTLMENLAALDDVVRGLLE